jgi:hypothetical protein
MAALAAALAGQPELELSRISQKDIRLPTFSPKTTKFTEHILEFSQP